MNSSPYPPFSPHSQHGNSGKRLEDFAGHIEFKNVAFTYPSRKDVPIFQGVCRLLTVCCWLIAAALRTNPPSDLCPHLCFVIVRPHIGFSLNLSISAFGQLVP